MKKTIALLTSLIMIMVMSLTVLADDAGSKDVTATYKPGEETEKIYLVDVVWGSMAFTYTDASEGEWNAEEHKYENATPASWSCTADANKITVTNHSNTSVDVTLAYQKTVDGITGSFDKGTFTLASAVGTTVANAPKDNAFLSLSGALANGSNNTVVGSVKVTFE